MAPLQRACDPAGKFETFFVRLVAEFELVLMGKEIDPHTRQISEMVLKGALSFQSGVAHDSVFR